MFNILMRVKIMALDDCTIRRVKKMALEDSTTKKPLQKFLYRESSSVKDHRVDISLQDITYDGPWRSSFPSLPADESAPAALSVANLATEKARG